MRLRVKITGKNQLFVTCAGFGSVPGVVFGLWGRSVNESFIDSFSLFFIMAVLVPAVVIGTFGWLLLRRRVKQEKIGRVGSLSFLIMAAALIWLSLSPRQQVEGVDLLVFGVDGATYSVLDPMIEADALPTFELIRGEGAYTTLHSMEPMFSPLLWTTMATGRPPEEHGVMGFHVHATDVQVPRFWDVAEAEGRSLGIYKWLVTYPPREVDGFIVPAWLAPGPETWPSELSPVKEIELSNRLKRQRVDAVRGTPELLIAAIESGLRFSTVFEAISWKFTELFCSPNQLERRRRLEHLRVEMDRDVFAMSLVRYSPQVATFTDYATDGLAHLFWRWHEPSAFEDVAPEDVARYGEVLRDAYRQADDVLAELIELVGEETTVVVLSDHGFQALHDGGENRSFFSPKTERLDARLDELLGDVDVSRLGIKLTVAAVAPTIVMEELRAEIEQLLDENGEPFFVVSDVPGAERSLGLTLANEEVDEERIANGSVGGEPMRAYLKLDDVYSGDHHENGIFMAIGPEIEAGLVPEFGLIDVAPTLHALMGIAPAQDLSGEVQIVESELGPATRDNLVGSGVWREGADGVNEEQLRALGYIQ